jgi:hypothetical protein
MKNFFWVADRANMYLCVVVFLSTKMILLTGKKYKLSGAMTSKY